MVVMLGSSSTARAGGDALELIREGVALRGKGNDEGALERFRQAYEIDHSARALAQMALAEQALGRWVPAYEHLTQALTATSDPWIKKNGAVLRASSDEVGEHVGKLEVLGGSPGAEVRVNGVPYGTLPLAGPLVLPIGSAVVTLGREGFLPVQRVALIRAQKLARESFDPLVSSVQTQPSPVSGLGPVAAAEPANQTSPGAQLGRSEPSRRDDTPPEAGSPGWTKVKWIAWGTAGVALGLGVVAYTQQSSAANQFNGSCYYDPMGTVHPNPSASLSLDKCRSLVDRQNSWYAAEIGGFVGAGTFAALGLVLFLLEPSSSSSSASSAQGTSAALSCAPGSAGGGTASIGCTWRF